MTADRLHQYGGDAAAAMPATTTTTCTAPYNHLLMSILHALGMTGVTGVGD